MRLATTANIALHGLQTIDGVAADVGDRVLVKNQADASENGIYTASEGQWFRAADARTARTMQKGTTVTVQEGSANANKIFKFETLSPVIGDDALSVINVTPIFTADADASAFAFVIDEDDMASNSATKVPTQQSVKAYVDGKIIDEDNMASNSATKAPSQQSVKAYVDVEDRTRSGRTTYSGYTPVYDLATDTMSVQQYIDIGDQTIPSGADNQLDAIRIVGTVRNGDSFETLGGRGIAFVLDSYNCDAYNVIASVTLHSGAKGVKSLYGRAVMNSTDAYVSGDYGGVGVDAGVTLGAGNTSQSAFAIQLDISGAGTSVTEQMIHMDTDDGSRTVDYGIFAAAGLGLDGAFARAFNSGTGSFLMWQAPDAGGAGVHYTLFEVDDNAVIYQRNTSNRQLFRVNNGSLQLGNTTDAERKIEYFNSSGSFSAQAIGTGDYFRIGKEGGTDALRLKSSVSVLADTAMSILAQNNGGTGVKAVTLGAADSGGAGYRVLRVVN